MFTIRSIVEQITDWKRSRQAIILSHLYQDDEIQEVADVLGDTLDLARRAEALSCQVLVVCGAEFMAEFVKVLNPARTVLLPDRNAGCSLADSCTAEAVRAFRRQHPDHLIVSYMNTTAAVKAESDVLCTSQNAVAVLRSLPAEQPLLFLPDINLGNWLKRQTGRKNMQIWQGACLVHATVPARRLAALRFEHPSAPVMAHPGCSEAVLRNADFIGSELAMLAWCGAQTATEFIVCAESGLGYSLRQAAPGKRFFFATNENCNCSECPYLRMNSLEKLLACLQNLQPRIELEDRVIERARLPYERMLTVQ